MSDFSIDYILNRAGDKYLGSNSSIGLVERMRLHEFYHRIQVTEQNHDNQMELPSTSFINHTPIYDWLQYTRYHPPKLPRNFRTCNKRTPGRLPRIPFTPTQLQALENAYKHCTYLSAEEANKLATILDLTNTRVKIWFQNRRARERREKRDKNENCDSTLSPNTSSSEQEVDLVDITD